jgi:hypothetical protein
MSRYTPFDGDVSYDAYLWDGDLTSLLDYLVARWDDVRMWISGPDLAEIIVGAKTMFLCERNPDSPPEVHAWDIIDRWVGVNIGDALILAESKPGFIVVDAQRLSESWTLIPEEEP